MTFKKNIKRRDVIIAKKLSYIIILMQQEYVQIKQFWDPSDMKTDERS